MLIFEKILIHICPQLPGTGSVLISLIYDKDINTKSMAVQTGQFVACWLHLLPLK